VLPTEFQLPLVQVPVTVPVQPVGHGIEAELPEAVAGNTATPQEVESVIVEQLVDTHVLLTDP
jgi:hypothetical protein